MARIHPHGWQALAADLERAESGASLALQREIDTLRRLADTLPDDIAIYHGVHWTRLTGAHSVVDDIDFVLVGPRGRVLLIEQVAGFLSESPRGLSRRRSGDAPLIAATLAETIATLGGRLRRARPEGIPASTPYPVALDALLYCPDYTVREAGTAGLPPERIVDATRREHLPEIALALLAPSDDPPPDAPSALAVAALHRFFADLLDLTPETSAIVGGAHALTTRLASGLADWARRLHFSPHRLRVVGTAGSGKTQLALAAIRDGAAAGRRVHYVCYNRPLADHVGELVAADAFTRHVGVGTFHQWCDRIARGLGRLPDFGAPGAFRLLEQAVAEATDEELAPWRCDELVVDEGQDFEPAWANILFRLLAPPGRAWWLEDPRQNLYGRPPVALPAPEDWVELRCQANYRTPRAVLEGIATMLGEAVDAKTGCPILGETPRLLTYRASPDHAGLFEQTKKAIGLAIGAGFRREMIAVLSYRGREHSALADLERLGPYRLRGFTGRYDLLGNPSFRDGDVLVESVMRFKGQAAPCVILSEIDFAELDDKARRRLFVGATRATMALYLVAEEGSARLLTPPDTLT